MKTFQKVEKKICKKHTYSGIEKYIQIGLLESEYLSGLPPPVCSPDSDEGSDQCVGISVIKR